MSPTELRQLAGLLTNLQDYLRDQTRLALAVGHTTDARAFQAALQMTIAAQSLLEA